MTYCISDIHGCYDEFMQLLKKIKFGSDDTLYILGDAIDRGPDSIKCVQYIMEFSNMRMLMGNHEQMMVDFFSGGDGGDWMRNGGKTTLTEFCALERDEQLRIIDYLMDLPYTAEVRIDDQNYVLVHAGLNVKANLFGQSQVSTNQVLANQFVDDVLWIREKFYRKKALPRSIVIFGHTPNQHLAPLEKNENPKIWHDEEFKDKIGIDGGCVYGGALHALRLDDLKEYSVMRILN